MNHEFVGVHSHNQTQCDVCGIDVTTSQARMKESLGYVVCRSLECKRIIEQKSVFSIGFFNRQVETRKQITQARLALESAEAQRIEKLQTREAEENDRIRKLVATQKPDLPESIDLINIPTGLSKLSPLPQSRIEKYKSHLQQNIRAASQLSGASELTDYTELKARRKSLAIEQKLDDNPELRVISDHLCGTCKGGCCPLGKDHAFNTVSTMRRFMDANPALNEEEVLSAYLDRIEPQTAEGSCINQTKNGCGLPREMRSDTCNGYYCDEIKYYHLDFSETNREVKALIAVQRAYTHWDRLEPDSQREIVSVNVVSGTNSEPIDLSGPEDSKN